MIDDHVDLVTVMAAVNVLFTEIADITHGRIGRDVTIWTGPFRARMTHLGHPLSQNVYPDVFPVMAVMV